MMGICKWCGKEFDPTDTKGRRSRLYCSKQCMKNASNDKYKKTYQSNRQVLSAWRTAVKASRERKKDDFLEWQARYNNSLREQGLPPEVSYKKLKAAYEAEKEGWA